MSELLKFKMNELLKFKKVYGDKPVINGFGFNINPSIEIYEKIQKILEWRNNEIKLLESAVLNKYFNL